MQTSFEPPTCTVEPLGPVGRRTRQAHAGPYRGTRRCCRSSSSRWAHSSTHQRSSASRFAETCAGHWSARRGAYRVISRLDDDRHPRGGRPHRASKRRLPTPLTPAITHAAARQNGGYIELGAHPSDRPRYFHHITGRQPPGKAIQERLGHSSITVTHDRYGHLFPKPTKRSPDGSTSTTDWLPPVPRRAIPCPAATARTIGCQPMTSSPAEFSRESGQSARLNRPVECALTCGRTRWRRWDSNPRPPACKAGALAN